MMIIFTIKAFKSQCPHNLLQIKEKQLKSLGGKTYLTLPSKCIFLQNMIIGNVLLWQCVHSQIL